MKFFLLAFASLFIRLSNSWGQDLMLHLYADENSSIEREYRFEKVSDDRDAKNIGFVYDAKRNKRVASFGGNLEQQTLDFFSSRLTPTLNSSYTLQVKIYQLDLSEIYRPDQRGYKGEIQLSLGFFLVGKDKPTHLVDFTGKASYGRPDNQMDNIQTSIQRLFENSYDFFDSWLTTQYQSNRSLAKKVRLNIIDPIRPSAGDTVFYNPERPLTWDDFRDRPNPRSSFNATIFSSLSIEGNASVEAGEIVQNIKLKVYMIPSQSWVKDANTYANNHEQRHFDLTRIAADRMIFKLENLELEPYLYEAKLNDIYLDAHREMTRLQDLYDGQTRHGLNKIMQANWNQAITKALTGDMDSLERLIEQ